MATLGQDGVQSGQPCPNFIWGDQAKRKKINRKFPWLGLLGPPLKLLADTKSFWSEEGLLRKAPCMSKLLFKNYLITFTFIRFQRTYDGFYQDVHIFATKKRVKFSGPIIFPKNFAKLVLGKHPVLTSFHTSSWHPGKHFNPSKTSKYARSFMVNYMPELYWEDVNRLFSLLLCLFVFIG